MTACSATSSASIHQGDGYAKLAVDATEDIHNIWWAVFNRPVSDYLNLKQLANPGWELRIEAKIRSSHAPQRVNLSFNTQRTTDYQSHLMEYDIPEPDTWKVISLTTENFDGGPGDRINCQMALMDWGTEHYQVEVDYVKVEVVKRTDATTDLGEPIPYHPTAPEVEYFTHTLSSAKAATIDSSHPTQNVSSRPRPSDESSRSTLSVSRNNVSILNWDFTELQDYEVTGPALLQLTTISASRPERQEDDLGLLRISEMFSRSSNWDPDLVTWNNLHQGQPTARVINPQMIIDQAVVADPEAQNSFVLSAPAVRRLFEGKSNGIALSPLGDIEATFFGSQSPEEFQPRLLLRLEKKPVSP